MKYNYVSLKEFIQVCNKFFIHLTNREICYLYVSFDDSIIKHWTKIEINEMIIIYIQKYITQNK